MIYKNISELVGNTPIISLGQLKKIKQLPYELYAKLEMFNPTGSVKDRAALQMIVDAEEQGILKSNSVIIEPTSGNTGIGLAALGTARGYRVILCMPESMSVERRKLMEVYGAELVLTPKEQGMKGAIARALELKEEIQNAWIPSQFDNPSNPKIHYQTTAPEIFQALPEVDYIICGIGTGGTVTGIGTYIKEHGLSTKLIGVEPVESPVITKGVSGPHGIQGIGAGFIPKNLNTDFLHQVVTVTTDEAKAAMKELLKEESIFCGISSGATIAALSKLSLEGKVLVVFPDNGDRYLSLL